MADTSKREPMIFAAAGTVFGFVLGYMVAGIGAEARPAPSVMPPDRPAAGSAAPAAPALDPNELRALESLAERDKANAEVRAELGNLLMDHSRFDEAARWYREALALKPDVPDVLVDLGACLVNAGKPTEGLVEFDKALKKDPGHKKAAFNKGIALMETGRREEAVAVWEDLLKRFPNDTQLAGLRQQIDQARAAAKGPS